MREYIGKDWIHGRPAWHRTKALLQDYDRLILERHNILHGGTPPPDGMPRPSGTGNPTEQKALRLARIDDDIMAVEQSAKEMCERMGNNVSPEFDPIRAFWSYDYYCYRHIKRPSERTWRRYRAALLSTIARRAKII